MDGVRAMTEVETVLTAARELLLRTSWDPTVEARDDAGQRIAAVWKAKSYSLVGAITHVCHDDKAIAKVVCEVLGSGGLTMPVQLTKWENAAGRTLDDVVALVDKALEVERG